MIFKDLGIIYAVPGDRESDDDPWDTDVGSLHFEREEDELYFWLTSMARRFGEERDCDDPISLP